LSRRIPILLHAHAACPSRSASLPRAALDWLFYPAFIEFRHRYCHACRASARTSPPSHIAHMARKHRRAYVAHNHAQRISVVLVTHTLRLPHAPLYVHAHAHAALPLCLPLPSATCRTAAATCPGLLFALPIIRNAAAATLSYDKTTRRSTSRETALRLARLRLSTVPAGSRVVIISPLDLTALPPAYTCLLLARTSLQRLPAPPLSASHSPAATCYYDFCQPLRDYLYNAWRRTWAA